jgi:peptide/nickel transport system permease protein
MNFPFKPVVLTTDALIFLLLAVVAASAWYISRYEHLRAPWKKVAHSRSGMIAAVIMLAFVTVGFLDSFAFPAPVDQRRRDGQAKLCGGRHVGVRLIAAPLKTGRKKPIRLLSPRTCFPRKRWSCRMEPKRACIQD